MDQIGSPPRLAKAMKDAIEAYFGKAAPWLEKEMAAGRADGKYDINSDQLAGTIVPAVQAFFVVRDAALAEAAERAGAARDGALTMLALAGLAVRGAARRACRRHRDAAPARDHAAGDLDGRGRRPRRRPA